MVLDFNKKMLCIVILRSFLKVKLKYKCLVSVVKLMSVDFDKDWMSENQRRLFLAVKSLCERCMLKNRASKENRW